MSQQALFVWGGWEGHEPKQSVDLIAPLLRSAGLDVTVRDTLAALNDSESLRQYAVVIPCWTMGQLTDRQERSLVTAVRQGVGLAGWHGGMGDAFRASTDYQFMVGGQFVAHPGGIIDYRVEIVDSTHPITRGVNDFQIRSEQYYMHVDPSNHVLAVTEFSGEPCAWIVGCRMPVVWTRPFGEGRVFYCSIGHGAEDLRIGEVREIVRRGILWAAGASPDAGGGGVGTAEVAS